MNNIVIFTVCIITGCFAQQQGPLPTVLSQVAIEGSDSGACPAESVIQQERNKTGAAIQSILHNVVHDLNRHYCNQPECPCGGSGHWTRIAYLDMSDPSQQCPSNWSLTTTPVRGCGRSSHASQTCDSASFSSNGKSYSRACGRVNAYQRNCIR